MTIPRIQSGLITLAALATLLTMARPGEAQAVDPAVGRPFPAGDHRVLVDPAVARPFPAEDHRVRVDPAVARP